MGASAFYKSFGKMTPRIFFNLQCGEKCSVRLPKYNG
jgi:hypothetical protein